MITVQSSKTNFYYQPAFLASISSWSWTLLVLIMGVIFWLEVTHFNWITAVFFIVFIIIFGVEYFTRSMLVQADKLVVNRSLQKSWLVMNVADIQTMKLTKFGISFMFNSDQYSFYLSKKNREYLFQTLKDKRAGIAG